MTTLLIQNESTLLTVILPGSESMTTEQFHEFCQANRDLRIERTATGEVIVMPPAFFVIELRPQSDTLKDLQAKMQEYIANGASLGWLIDRQIRKVYIYRPNCEVEVLDNPETVSGEPELPGFVLQMAKIW